jgi:hypothetical protein
LVFNRWNWFFLESRFAGVKLKPANGDLAIRPGGGDVGPGAEDVMEMIDKDGKSADIDCENAGEELHALDDPCLAVRVILMRDGIIAIEKSPTDATGETMKDAFLPFLDIFASR